MKSRKPAEIERLEMSFGFKSKDISAEQIQNSWQHILEGIQNKTPGAKSSGSKSR